MRVSDVAGWPPRRFQHAEGPPRRFSPEDPRFVRLISATFIRGGRGARASGDLLLLLECRKTGTMCTGRVRLRSAGLGARLAALLSRCKGLTLAEAGNRLIPGEGQPVSFDRMT